jgi:hypothetical protein
MSVIDLSAPPQNHSYSVSIGRDETRPEMVLRLARDLLLFLVAVGFVAVMAWICVEALRSPTASADEKKWAMSVLSAATGGVVGYLVRR